MLKQNSRSGRRGGGVGDRLLPAVLTSFDDETYATLTSTTSHGYTSTPQLPFGRPLSPPSSEALPTNNVTGIGARLDAAVAAAKPVNRSADLVPLTQDYYKMKKQLKSLTNAARVYHSSMLQMNEARCEVARHFSSIYTSSPIHEKIGGNGAHHPSFVSVNQEATDQFQRDVVVYKQTIVQYLEEWKCIVTSRVDAGLNETRKLQETLFHYQSKVNKLRSRVMLNEDRRGSSGSSSVKCNSNNNKSAAALAKLSDKLERNTQKLDQAWKSHECAASKLCCLIEEVTLRGWKDLYPVVQLAMEWQAQRASAESRTVPSLVMLQDQFQTLCEEKIQLAPEEEPMQVVVAVAAAASSLTKAAKVQSAIKESDIDVNDSVEEEEEEGLEVAPISYDHDEMDDDVVIVSNKEGKQDEFLQVVHAREDMNDNDIPVVSTNHGNRRLRDFFKILRKQTTTSVPIEKSDSTDDDVHEDYDSNRAGETASPATASMFQDKEEDNIEDGAAVRDTETSFVQSTWESFMFTDDDVFVDGRKESEELEPVVESSPFDEELVQDIKYNGGRKAVSTIAQGGRVTPLEQASSDTSVDDDDDEPLKPTDIAFGDYESIVMMEDDATRITPKKQNLSSSSSPEKEMGYTRTSPRKEELAVDNRKSLNRKQRLSAIDTMPTSDTDDEEQDPETPNRPVSV